MQIENEIWLWGPQFPAHLDSILSELSGPKRAIQHIAVDGGVLIKPRLAKSYQDQLIAIGDGDSGPIELLNHVHPAEKDHSDLALALQYIQLQYPMPVHIRAIGFCGGRLDHHMISQGCFSRFLKAKPQSQIRLDQQWLMLSQGRWMGQISASLVSLLTFSQTNLTLQGDWRWKLDNEEVQALDDRLLSNCVGAQMLELSSSQPLCLYSDATICDWWKHV